jgi:hypothetical protein
MKLRVTGVWQKEKESTYSLESRCVAKKEEESKYLRVPGVWKTLKESMPLKVTCVAIWQTKKETM